MAVQSKSSVWLARLCVMFAMLSGGGFVVAHEKAPARCAPKHGSPAEFLCGHSPSCAPAPCAPAPTCYSAPDCHKSYCPPAPVSYCPPTVILANYANASNLLYNALTVPNYLWCATYIPDDSMSNSTINHEIDQLQSLTKPQFDLLDSQLTAVIGYTIPENRLSFIINTKPVIYELLEAPGLQQDLQYFLQEVASTPPPRSTGNCDPYYSCNKYNPCYTPSYNPCRGGRGGRTF